MPDPGKMSPVGRVGSTLSTVAYTILIWCLQSVAAELQDVVLIYTPADPLTDIQNQDGAIRPGPGL